MTIEKNLGNKKGIERNLLAKKFIQKILYSKQSIKIALFYAENPQDFQKLSSQNNTASLVRGGAKNSETSKEKSVFPNENKFVACNVAARLGFEPRLMDSESTFLPLEDLALLILSNTSELRYKKKQFPKKERIISGLKIELRHFPVKSLRY